MKKRIISAIVALLIFMPLLIVGGIPFKILITILSILGIHEILKTQKEVPMIIKYLSYILIGIITFTDINIILKIFITFLTIYCPLIFYDKEKYNIVTSSYICNFIIFLGIVFNYVCTLRDSDINVIIYLLLITILTDTFALFGGKMFGKHKLNEKVSPNKTIEGSVIGSLVASIIASIYYLFMVDPGISIYVLVLITIILTIIGQMGDLFFSSIKRYFMIKDFSNIMPGHGGILDRLDSIIFVVIGYLLIINII